MASETLGKIFEPYFAAKDLGKRTGLGLATVYGIIKQNNGYITVDSEMNKGTTLRIYLPRHAMVEEHLPEHNPAVPDIGRNESILLVEDERAILLMTRNIPESLGSRVLTAVTLQRALDIAMENEIHLDLFITEVVMPGKKRPVTGRSPVQ